MNLGELFGIGVAILGVAGTIVWIVLNVTGKADILDEIAGEGKD